MPTRPRLEDRSLSPAAIAVMEGFHSDVVKQVQDAIKGERVVVVGMAQNPHVGNVRKALDQAGVAYKYLEYGSYFSQWKQRLAIKLWSGFPTFPQVFVNGTLVGGEDLTKAAIADGSLQSQLTVAPAQATA